MKIFNTLLSEPGDKLPIFIKLMKKDDVEFILDEIKAVKTINKPEVDFLHFCHFFDISDPN